MKSKKENGGFNGTKFVCLSFEKFQFVNEQRYLPSYYSRRRFSVSGLKERGANYSFISICEEFSYAKMFVPVSETYVVKFFFFMNTSQFLLRFLHFGEWDLTPRQGLTWPTWPHGSHSCNYQKRWDANPAKKLLLLCAPKDLLILRKLSRFKFFLAPVDFMVIFSQLDPW